MSKKEIMVLLAISILVLFVFSQMIVTVFEVQDESEFYMQMIIIGLVFWIVGGVKIWACQMNGTRKVRRMVR